MFGLLTLIAVVSDLTVSGITNSFEDSGNTSGTTEVIPNESTDTSGTTEIPFNELSSPIEDSNVQITMNLTNAIVPKRPYRNLENSPGNLKVILNIECSPQMDNLAAKQFAILIQRSPNS